MIDKGEMTRTKTLLVLLDWEKAFDKVRHDKLLEAIRRMRAPPKFISVIESLYAKPTFMVEMDA